MGKRDEGTLAGLAALAGAAYLYNNQKNKDADKAAIAGVENTRAARPESVETRLKTPAQSIAEADKSSKDNSIVGKGLSGTTTLGADKSEPNLDAKSAPVKVTNLKPADNNVDPYANYQGGDLLTGAEPRTKPASNVADAVRNEDAAKSVAKSAQADANRSAKAGDNVSASKKYSVATDQYKNLSRAASVTDARKREAEQARMIKLQSSGGRRATGGAIKTTKMASGGITSSASRRADGIASKGKTRGKIC